MTEINTVAEECENGLIGCTWLFFDEVKPYQTVVSASDFKDFELSIMWDLFKESSSVDEYHEKVIVNAKERGLSATFISGLMDWYSARPSFLAWNVEKVKHCSLMRKTRRRLLEVINMDDMEVPNALDKLAVEVKAAMVSSINDEPQQLADEFIESISRSDVRDRIKTGFPTFDHSTQGLRLGNISVIGALPSTGKTALALCIMAQALKDGKKIVFFSNEMTATQLLERYASNSLNLSYRVMNNRSLEPDDIKKAGRMAVEMANKKNLWLVDKCRYIEQQADRVLRIKPDFVIVDYLQIVRTRERFNSKPDMIEWLVDEYKRIALSNHCHVLVLSQHSRGASHDKASMFNLKGSSGIEAGGDYIAILDRPNVYDHKEPPEKAELSLVKNKFGNLSVSRLWFDGDRQRFRELADHEGYPVPIMDEEKPF